MRQHQEIAAKERELKVREQHLQSLKKSRKKPRTAYVCQLETEVDEQNDKLKKLWGIQDEVASYKLSNGALGRFY